MKRSISIVLFMLLFSTAAFSDWIVGKVTHISMGMSDEIGDCITVPNYEAIRFRLDTQDGGFNGNGWFILRRNVGTDNNNVFTDYYKELLTLLLNSVHTGNEVYVRYEWSVSNAACRINNREKLVTRICYMDCSEYQF